MPFYKFGKVGNDNLLTLKKDLSNYDNGAGEGISSI
jgi:hypothetical protein